MADINRAYAYKFLAKLVETFPDDAIGVMKDMIVDYWFFPNGDGELAALSALDQELAQMMSEGQKIQAIKKCREVTGMGLKEAKDYVEGKGWPLGSGRTEQALQMQKKFVQGMIQKIGKDFKMDGFVQE